MTDSRSSTSKNAPIKPGERRHSQPESFDSFHRDRSRESSPHDIATGIHRLRYMWRWAPFGQSGFCAVRGVRYDARNTLRTRSGRGGHTHYLGARPSRRRSARRQCRTQLRSCCRTDLYRAPQIPEAGRTQHQYSPFVTDTTSNTLPYTGDVMPTWAV